MIGTRLTTHQVIVWRGCCCYFHAHKNFKEHVQFEIQDLFVPPFASGKAILSVPWSFSWFPQGHPFQETLLRVQRRLAVKGCCVKRSFFPFFTCGLKCNAKMRKGEANK